ncbi:hypothetical protein AGLY_007411 [Aphis glycines]|uniref:Uncharacterized protein n=1 Tax=Aphis glycines TaxID=307491 RepID=A0A6G0TQU8_APHGL|nr:hypothetical protein AGLY_007411 [Aphis glycines]
MNDNHFNILLSNVPLGPRIKFESKVKKYQASLIQNSEHTTVNKTFAIIINNADEISQKVSKVTTENQVFQLHNILKNYPQGSFVLNYIEKHNILNESCRNVLVEIIINDLIKRKSHMTFRLANLVADAITGTFPTEIKDTYFLKDAKNSSPKGKLYAKYYNTIRSMKQNGLIPAAVSKERSSKPLSRTMDKKNNILVDNVEDNFIPITVNEVEEVEEDLNDSNFNPDLTPITEYQDNQLIEVSRKKTKFSPADKKSVLEDKRELKNVNAKTKHPNRPLTCPVECKNKCRDNLSTDHQKLLWKTYWSLTTYVQRRQFLAKCITLTSVKRRTTVEGSVDNFKKSQSRIYKLPDSEKNEVQVCKTTLLNVLGYTNDSVLTELVKNMNSNFCMSSVSENRGQQNIKKCIAKDIVVDHIKLYKPSVSHYRRLNAPNIMYLPFGLTVKAMYDDFCLQHKNYCSQEFYRQIIKDLNISLRNPTIDKCEDCSTYQNIIENSTDENEIRVNITLLENHKAKALAANLKNCISQSRQNLNILELKDFYEWQNKKRTTNVKTDTLYGFKMNKDQLVWNTGQIFGEPKTLNLLQKKFLKDIKTYAPKKITQLRGINLNKKKGIVDKLVPVMPENRKHFWINLPVSDASEDLVDEMDLVLCIQFTATDPDSEIVSTYLNDKDLTWPEIEDIWRKTINYRLNYIKQNNATDIFNKWQQYTQPMDYKLEKSRDCESRKLLETFGSLIQDISTDSKTLIIMYLLHCIFIPISKKSTKDSNGKRGFIKFSRRGSQNSFLVVTLTAVEMELTLKKMAENGPIQPCLLVVGSLFDPKQILVYFDNIKYKIFSAYKAFDICFKIYHAFNVEYPLESGDVWLFIRVATSTIF